jgi:predicted nucleic acid-binding protein
VAERFFDTNVLLYLVTPGAKADQAEALVVSGGVISVQVLNEFVSVARRKHGTDWDKLTDLLAGFRLQFRVEPITVAIQERAVAIAEAHRLNIYDANILAAAEQAGCDVLYSEDMQHGQRIGALTIRNPFADAVS